MLAALHRADVSLFRRMRSCARPPASDTVRTFSKLGEHAAVWLVLGVAGMVVDRPRRVAWRRGTAAVASAYVLNTALKLAVRRQRPALDGLPPLIGTPTGLSFPSAHASASFAAARAYGAILPSAPLYATATAMALSRIYLGVHYPSDVAAGALLGTAIGSMAR